VAFLWNHTVKEVVGVFVAIFVNCSKQEFFVVLASICHDSARQLECIQKFGVVKETEAMGLS
jgi:hypothetical protein